MSFYPSQNDQDQQILKELQEKKMYHLLTVSETANSQNQCGEFSNSLK